MATPPPFYKTRYGRSFEAGKGLPVVSTDLDSIRTYSFEVHFAGLPDHVAGGQQDLTLAAKQTSPIGFAVEEIVAERIGDKLFYPGKASPDEFTVTFDYLMLRNTGKVLFEWMKSIYNPLTGELTQNSRPGGGNSPHFKANKMEIVLLDNVMTPHSSVELYGVWPKLWKLSELNSSTNEFATVEAIFRWDAMDLIDHRSN